MNKKGFTLVELLAVIIILALLAVVANSSVTNVVKNSKNDLYNTQIELIKSAAQTWGTDNIDKLPEEDSCAYLKLKDLKSYGLFDEEVINPKTNKEFSKDLKIKITSKTNGQGVLKTIYEVDSKSVSDCIEVYPPICTLVNDADNNNKITPGDEYTCTVKENTNYTFYVLSKNDNGTHNLIMNSNINSLGEAITSNEIGDKGFVEWISEEDYGCGVDGDYCQSNDKGPVTALTYLHNATKDWTNISSIEVDYEDENISYETGKKGTTGYGRINTKGTTTTITDKNGNKTLVLENLKTRLPQINELIQIGCILDTENSCPTWISNNLDFSEGEQGYWTLSSGAENYISFGWFVIQTGALYHIEEDGFKGVRPVITLTLD